MSSGYLYYLHLHGSQKKTLNDIKTESSGIMAETGGLGETRRHSEYKNEKPFHAKIFPSEIRNLAVQWNHWAPWACRLVVPLATKALIVNSFNNLYTFLFICSCNETINNFKQKREKFWYPIYKPQLEVRVLWLRQTVLSFCKLYPISCIGSFCFLF